MASLHPTKMYKEHKHYCSSIDALTVREIEIFPLKQKQASPFPQAFAYDEMLLFFALL